MKMRAFKRGVIKTLRDAGVETPEIDARLIIEAVTGWTRSDMILNANETIPNAWVQCAEVYMQRRISGEPIDHILGYREFYGRRFDISKAVLSPRPETEELVSLTLGLMNGVERPRILDLGTGSGAIIITLLAEHPGATGFGVDTSKEALNLARQNAETHKVCDRLTLFQGDWFEPVTGTYDIIVSNPPYITDADMEGLASEVRQFDPDIALRGGRDGLQAYRTILQHAREHLVPGGCLVFEIGYDQAESVPGLLAEAGFNHIEVKKDLSGHDRIVSAYICDK